MSSNACGWVMPTEVSYIAWDYFYWTTQSSPTWKKYEEVSGQQAPSMKNLEGKFILASYVGFHKKMKKTLRRLWVWEYGWSIIQTQKNGYKMED